MVKQSSVAVRRAVFLAGWAAIALFPVPTFAQSSVSSQAAAESLYQEAVKLTEAGVFEPACEKFAASQKLDPTVGTQLRLADCHEQTGRFVSAWSMFRLAEGQARSQKQTERAELAARRAEELVDRLSYITLEIGAGKTNGLVVRLGEEKVPQAAWGTRVPVDAGKAVLTVSAPGHKSWSSSVVIKTGGQVTVKVPALKRLPQAVVKKPGGATSATRLPSDVDGSQPNLAAWIFGGAGLVGLIGGGAFAYQAYSLNEDSIGECQPDRRDVCSPRGVSLRNDAGTFADIATVSTAAGGALLATGALLLLLGDDGNDNPMIDASQPQEPDLALGVAPLPSGGAVNIRGVW